LDFLKVSSEKNETETRITILQKIDGVLRKGIAEAVSEEQPEEII